MDDDKDAAMTLLRFTIQVEDRVHLGTSDAQRTPHPGRHPLAA
jgi:hypothetical protein